MSDSTIDQETEAMKAVHKVLEPFDDAARRRIIAWVSQKVSDEQVGMPIPPDPMGEYIGDFPGGKPLPRRPLRRI